MRNSRDGLKIIRRKVYFFELIFSASHQRPSTHLDPATPPTWKEGHCKPAKLQGLNLIKPRCFSKYSIIAIFFMGVDTFSPVPENRIA
jgi:hypothetical protein